MNQPWREAFQVRSKQWTARSELWLRRNQPLPASIKPGLTRSQQSPPGSQPCLAKRSEPWTARDEPQPARSWNGRPGKSSYGPRVGHGPCSPGLTRSHQCHPRVSHARKEVCHVRQRVGKDVPGMSNGRPGVWQAGNEAGAARCWASPVRSYCGQPGVRRGRSGARHGQQGMAADGQQEPAHAWQGRLGTVASPARRQPWPGPH